ncbi:hypothetical protein A2803_05910 [Candidatus Woesebacteria bacterium RIFCSPHIGHO2_01_FULL_44_21]|uniref:UmuC domain-containing protein n=1 Tax=Candidatus Woesebacteria bacterium RIFCSPHIGHO2_01_FULL_44_21 TaxID=1802503 RepID=A0A1F7YZW4_9BACT|nr:MAG: hypothetical protein A2803_05910 [Candidatus Woesebacteria bacterium RIFCSPHIGHO2_01_FULL_44_21]OGM71084.1 MAG: hypothetical protein A2897_02515 [Candidatus Woesebacteria bacterium RIFCSPLOWO2_01_FULL_44_24b]
MDFNPSAPTVMHIDINSCFATIEQQANPLLRGLPIAVVAYDSPRGVILAASIEAKRFGVKTGMRLMDGRQLVPELTVVLPDPDKYRFVHKKLNKLLSKFCSEIYPKSIDEFVLDFQSHRVESLPAQAGSMQHVARDIKRRIEEEIGEWITVSIGISTNRQLAKVAAGMVKPDGLVEINGSNFRQVYKSLKLTDMHGINTRYAVRLNAVGIHTVPEFYESTLSNIEAAFRSVNAFYWYLRLRGYEVDGIEFGRKSFGNSYSIPQNLSLVRELSPILAKLVNKTATRLRKAKYAAYGVHVAVSFKGGGFWHHGERLPQPVFYTSDIFKAAYAVLKRVRINRPVHTLSVSCYDLVEKPPLQLSMFENEEKRQFLAQAMDRVNNRFGSFVLMTGNMLAAKDAVKDRIAFGQGGIS